MHVDLDAARQARAEARGEQPSVTFGGRRFYLVAELPFDAAEAWAKNDAPSFVSLVLADQAETGAFLALRPSWADLSGVLDAWKQTPGESGAS